MAIIRTSKQRRPARSGFIQQLIKTVTFRERTGKVFQLAASSRHEGGFPGICCPVPEYHPIQSHRLLVPQKIGGSIVKGEFDATVKGCLDHLAFVYRIADPELAHGAVCAFGEHLAFDQGDFADDVSELTAAAVKNPFVQRDTFIVTGKVGGPIPEGQFDMATRACLDHIAFEHRITDFEQAHDPVRAFSERLPQYRGDFADDVV